MTILPETLLLKRYETVLRKEVDREHRHPTRIILHTAGFDDSGNNKRVVDIWESEHGCLNNDFNNRLKPVMERINAPMPNGEIIPNHNVNAHSDIDTYRVR